VCVCALYRYIIYNATSSPYTRVYIITTAPPNPEGINSRATRYEKQLKTSRLISNRRSVTMSRPAYKREIIIIINIKKMKNRGAKTYAPGQTTSIVRRWRWRVPPQSTRAYYYYIDTIRIYRVREDGITIT